MNTTTRPIFSHKRIALVAHDSCKQNLLNWVKKHKEALAPHQPVSYTHLDVYKRQFLPRKNVQIFEPHFAILSVRCEPNHSHLTALITSLSDASQLIRH